MSYDTYTEDWEGGKKKFLSERTKNFYRGYACALTCIIKGHGISTEVEEAYKAGLPSVSKLKGIIDDYDYEILQKHFK